MNDADKMREAFKVWHRSLLDELVKTKNFDEHHMAKIYESRYFLAWQAASAEKDKLIAELVEKAQAVIDRWDSPDWKDGTHTGDYIYALRDVVNKVRGKV